MTRYLRCNSALLSQRAEGTTFLQDSWRLIPTGSGPRLLGYSTLPPPPPPVPTICKQASHIQGMQAIEGIHPIQETSIDGIRLTIGFQPDLLPQYPPEKLP